MSAVAKKRPAPVTAETKDRAAQLWAANVSFKDIAEQLGLLKHQLGYIVDRDRARFPLRQSGRVVSKAILEAVERASVLWLEGYSVRAIGIAIGRSHASIADLTRRFRDRFPPRGPVRIFAGKPRLEPDAVARPAAPVEPAKPTTVPAARLTAAAEVDPEEIVAQAEDRPARADAFRALRGSAPVSLADGRKDGCRWPIQLHGDPLRDPTSFVCDQPTARGPYCARHHSLSVRQAQLGRKAPALRLEVSGS